MSLRTHLSRLVLTAAIVLLGAACGGDSPGGERDSGPSPDTADVAVDGIDDISDVGDSGDANADADESDTGSDTADLDTSGGDSADTSSDSSPTDTGRDTFFDPDIPADTDTSPEPDGPLGLLAIDPSSGPASGGTFFVLFGFGFDLETQVTINGRLVEGLDLVDSETILARTPPNPAGTYDVKVADASGEAVLPGGFTYFADLAVTDVDPTSGPERGGVPMTLGGAGFTESTLVSVGGRLGIDIRVVSETEVEFILPAGVEGQADVRVTNEFGTSVAPDAFEYYAEPRVGAIVPAAGSTLGGYEVEVRGSGLASTTSVSFGPSPASFEIVDPGTVRATVPPGAPGPVDVTVVTRHGGATVVGGFFYVSDADGALRIDSILPRRGRAEGGYEVTLAGPGVGFADTVAFGDANATIVDLQPGVAVVEAPAGTGVVDVRVVAGDEEAVALDGFEYLPALQLTSVNPPRGDAAGGDAVTLTGTGFSGVTTVRFGPIPAASVSVSSDSEIEVVTPPNTIGPVDVTVADGARATTLADAFTYVDDPAVSSFVPTRGAIAGNTFVVIRGRGFHGDVQVFFGDNEAPVVDVVDAATIEVRTPPAPEPERVAVTVVVDGVELRTGKDFVYYDPFTPALGWWGDEIDGSVNATVLDGLTGERIENAFVTLHIRVDDTQYTCITNVIGQCTISHPAISGEQTISASAEGYSAVTVNHVDAENVVIVLSSTDPPTPGPPPEYIPPLIHGTLEGLDKITDPADDEIILGVIRTTTPGVGVSNPPGTGFDQVVWTSGSAPIPYEMFSREGELAVVALCGVYNEVSGDFTPLYMGVRRGMAVRGEGTEYEVDLECDIHMSQTMTFKFRNAPIYPGGPDLNQAIPYLDFGGEGATNLLRVAEGPDDIITGDHFAPLDAPVLDGVVYDIVGQTVVEDAGLPFSVVYARGISDPDDRIDFPVSMPPADLEYPSPGGTLVERRFEWSLSTSERPDFYYAFIQDLSQMVTFWEVWLPGDETGFNLPYFPEGTEADPLPSGALVFIVLAVDAITFDYDEFEFNDFGSNNWRSYSAAGWFFVNP